MSQPAAVSDRIEAIYELTPAQAGMLFDIQFAGDVGAYVMQQTLMVAGRFDPALAAAALRALTRRHDALRTLVLHRGVAEPRQVVLRDRPADFRLAPPAGAADGAQHLAEIARLDRQRGFDVERDPLIRVTCCPLGPDETALIWTLHHIAADGWCAPLLYGDFAAYYELLRSGASEAEVAARVDREREGCPRYRDFVLWLRRQDQAAALDYWDGVLRDVGQNVELAPWGPPEPRDRTGVWASVRLDAAVSTRLRTAALAAGTTVSTLVNAAWGLALWRATGVRDVVFGQVTAGRDVPIAGMDQVVGLFINTIPTRVTLDPAASVGALLADLGRQNAASAAFSTCSLAEVKARSPLGPKLVTTAVTYESGSVGAWVPDAISGLTLSLGEADQQIGYPLGLAAEDRDGKLELSVFYDPRIYPDAQGQWLAELVARAAKALAGDPGALVGDLDLVGEAGRLTTAGFNPAPHPVPAGATAVGLVEAALQQAGDTTVLTSEGHPWSGLELDRRAGRIAHALAAAGVRRGDFVAVATPRGHELVAALLGVWKAGAAYLPLDADHPAERLAGMVADAGARVLAHLGPAPVQPDGVTLVDLGALPDEPAAGPLAPAGPDDAAYCLFTSGSTGRPKGVVVEQGNLANLLLAPLTAEVLGGEGAMACTVTYTFDIMAAELWGCLALGVPLVMATERELAEPAVFDAMMRANNAVKIQSTPSRISYLMSDPASRGWLAGLKMVALVGEPFPPDLLARLAGNCPAARFYNLYGPTEATIWATGRRLWPGEPIDIGPPIGGYQVYVMDGPTPLGVGMAGELCIAGVGVARGYLPLPAPAGGEPKPGPFGANPFGPGR
ncbi:MAG: condensation domain-containing protein, partial [Propionibacteriaceae bacterium]|nr:condensation domain-containing protein [Propionibacteriaceae bacterium]